MFPYRLFLILVAAWVPGLASAQAISVIGGGADAHECFQSAQLAAANVLSGGFDDEPCTRALDLTALDLRDRTATYINRGILRVSNEEYQAGFKDYKKALEMSPETPETYVNLGNVYFLGTKYDTAVDFYTKALDLDIRKTHVAYLNRGLAHEKLGKLAEAEADYRRAIELAPEWPLPQTKLEALHKKKTAS